MNLKQARQNALVSYNTTLEDVPSPSTDQEQLGNLKLVAMNGDSPPVFTRFPFSEPTK